MVITQEQLINEEQEILEDLIRKMDQIILDLDKSYTDAELQIKKIKDNCLPDTYGELILNQESKKSISEDMKELVRTKDELYDTRLIVECSSYDSVEEENEIKVGLHSFYDPGCLGTPLILSWKMPVCRHYLLDNSSLEYDGIVEDKNGVFETHFKLKMKRRIQMFFDKVKSVSQTYPVDQETFQEIIADEFLKELMSRRAEKEFKNIVFSIQKHQGEIIQTPFRQNLIVQGCAGSGKSMIMLHRLPILLYDNPNDINKNNLYTITPSMSYIQMAKKMMIQLEIQDLKMGTLNQYYNHVIEKYGKGHKDYNTGRNYLRLDPEQVKYVYSNKFVRVLRKWFFNEIHDYLLDCSSGRNLLSIKIVRISKTDFINDIIQNKLLELQDLIGENEKRLKSYYNAFQDMMKTVDRFEMLLSDRKKSIIRAMRRRLKKLKESLKDINKSLERLPIEERRNTKEILTLKKTKEEINELERIIGETEKNDEYFNNFKNLIKEIHKIQEVFSYSKKSYHEISIEQLYCCVEDIKNVQFKCDNFMNEVCQYEDPYVKYKESIDTSVEKMRNSLNHISCDQVLLSINDYKKFITTSEKLQSKQNTIVQDIYRKINTEILKLDEKKDKNVAYECSPYIYLQILYNFYGRPKKGYETLISIDEAQNIAPEELRLIKRVNTNKVILDLYGDINQHVDGTKGFDTWEKIPGFSSYQLQEMNENYRNARQITLYCNKTFGLDMNAINLDGRGVHVIQDADKLNIELENIFQKPQNKGLSCIIVSNPEEAYTVSQIIKEYENKLNNVALSFSEIHPFKWNIMSIDQIKGLEFETVIAISGRMSKNEKYIAYTRALDELYVYDTDIPIIPMPQDLKKDEENVVTVEKPKKKDSQRKKRKKRSDIKDEDNKTTDINVKEFFESYGFVTMDDRMEGGSLRVFGEKSELEKIVEQVVEKYGINGSFTPGENYGYKECWITKTKK